MNLKYVELHTTVERQAYELLREVIQTQCSSLDDGLLINTVLNDAKVLKQKNAEYKDSWKKRGGVDTYFMLARKWDRIEAQVEDNGYNILDLATKDTRDEGLLDDIADLRRYLTLVEHEVVQRSEPGAGYVNQG